MKTGAKGSEHQLPGKSMQVWEEERKQTKDILDRDSVC